jgi:hypothetical protein
MSPLWRSILQVGVIGQSGEEGQLLFCVVGCDVVRDVRQLVR